MKQFFSKEKTFLVLILALALFLRFFRVTELMAFGGDVARDYLVARDITLKGEIPLVGSPASVPWLHQGAFFTYLLGIVLWVGKFNPLFGGYFVGIFGVLGVLGVYFLGKKLFSQRIGLLAAFFYSTSPLVVIFDRYPYHQSLISLFTIAFIFSLFLSAKKTKFFVLSFFLFGLLMQLELSDLVLLPILLIWLWDYRKNIQFKLLMFSLSAFVFTWIPKIIYDFKNGFTQTIGFIAWIIHKLPPVSFLVRNKDVSLPFFQRLETIFTYLSRIVFWHNKTFAFLIFSFLFFVLTRKFNLEKRKENLGQYLLLLWIVVPLIGFIIQGSPSEAYIPLFFGAVALAVGGGVFYVSHLPRHRLARLTPVILLGFLGLFNTCYLFKNNYFIKTLNKDLNYSKGISFKLNKDIAEFIVSDAGGQKFNLIALGNYGHFSSSILNTTYLTWYYGNEPSDSKQNLQYLLYDSSEDIDICGADFSKSFKYIMVARKAEK